MGEDNSILVKASVGTTGVSAEMKLPANVFAYLAPRIYRRRANKLAIESALLQKYLAGEAMTEAEQDYLPSASGAAEARLIREENVRRRAVEIAAVNAAELSAVQSPARLLEAIDSSPAPSRLSESERDWLAKFWDDAGLVSEEVMRELYARILAAPAAGAGKCSLQTLGVIRYLDSDVASMFGVLAKWAFNWRLIFAREVDLAAIGVPYKWLLELETAGLLEMRESVHVHLTQPYDAMRFGDWMFAFVGIEVPIKRMMLTRAGAELARVADLEHRLEDGFTSCRAVLRQGGGRVVYARLPHRRWLGERNDLTWFELPAEGADTTEPVLAGPW